MVQKLRKSNNDALKAVYIKKRIQNPEKYLWRSVLEKQLTAKSRELFWQSGPSWLFDGVLNTLATSKTF